ncbi:MAG: hypothetical protein M0P73_00885 [Syntrophobacterales bacterium]|nr:hypothetical protein [Syntrophobacterales bacterium]
MIAKCSFRLVTRIGQRASKGFARAMIYLMCLALAIPAIPPGIGLAQVTTDQVVSLKEVPIPVPMAAIIPWPITNIPGPGTDLNFQPLTTEIVKDQAALIRLGKALFWDMQVGSDGVQACATCHFNAGADIRTKNVLDPGLRDTNFNGPLGGDNLFGNSCVPFTANDPNTPTPPGPSDPPPANLNVPGFPQFTVNYQVTNLDFPFSEWDPATQLVPRGPGVTFVQEFATATKDTNDVVSSAGVRHTQFVGLQPGQAEELGTPLADIFNTLTPGQLNLDNRVRRVEPRNAPTPINAVFNFDNFWDGRASFIFNGCNPFGFRDRVSTLKKVSGRALTDVFLRITNSSLASQAVGPPGSDFEMSFAGRSLADIGKKLVTLRPLAKQKVHPQDSVLGPYARPGQNGLNIATYSDMIKAAFKDQWWNSPLIIQVDPATVLIQPPSAQDPRTMTLNSGQGVALRSPPRALTAHQYSLMMYNFSLFFGLAVQAYEATLVSDDTPFDRFMGAPSKGIAPDPNALTGDQSLGLSIFLDGNVNHGGKCLNCHVPPVTTSHSVIDYQPDAQGVPSVGGDELSAIQFMIMGDNLESASYDHGMYNIGARRTSEDIGRAATAPFINPLTNAPFPLSVTELAGLRQFNQLPPDVARFVPNTSVLSRRVTNGATKVPNLRNIKFSGPYFRTGDSATLRQAVEFYVRGGNFPNTNLHDLARDMEGISPLMFPELIPSALQSIQALVAFLADGLTDERVAFEKGPFDHPQLFIPNGADDNDPSQDVMVEIPAVGKDGRAAPLPTFLNLDPQTP